MNPHTSSGYAWDIVLSDEEKAIYLNQTKDHTPPLPPPSPGPKIAVPLFVILLLLVISGLSIFLFHSAKDTSNSKNSSTTSSLPIVISTDCLGDKELAEGYSGPEVECLHRIFNKLGYANLQGSLFTSETRDATISFQKDAGRSQDGIVGPRTKASLQDALDQLQE